MTVFIALCAQVQKAAVKFPHAVWWNLYGPTEATVLMTKYATNPQTVNLLPIIPIGKPVSNTATYVLDQCGHPCPCNVPGELFISGACLARGYHQVSASRLSNAFLPSGAKPHLTAPGAASQTERVRLHRVAAQRPEMNAERFVPNPFSRGANEARMYKTGDLVKWLSDGNLVFLGRTDHQVCVLAVHTRVCICRGG